MAESLKTEDAKIKGCQSQVWLNASLNQDGTVHFVADSDALIVRGLVAMLLLIYSEKTPQYILQTPPEFIEAIGLGQHLSPSRANGLFAIIKQIKYYALAMQSLS